MNEEDFEGMILWALRVLIVFTAGVQTGLYAGTFH